MGNSVTSLIALQVIETGDLVLELGITLKNPHLSWCCMPISAICQCICEVRVTLHTGTIFMGSGLELVSVNIINPMTSSLKLFGFDNMMIEPYLVGHLVCWNLSDRLWGVASIYLLGSQNPLIHWCHWEMRSFNRQPLTPTWLQCLKTCGIKIIIGKLCSLYIHWTSL